MVCPVYFTFTPRAGSSETLVLHGSPETCMALLSSMKAVVLPCMSRQRKREKYASAYGKRTHSEGREFNYFPPPDNLLLTLTFTLSPARYLNRRHSKMFQFVGKQNNWGQTLMNAVDICWHAATTSVTKLWLSSLVLEGRRQNVSSKHGNIQNKRASMKPDFVLLLSVKVVDVGMMADWIFPVISRVVTTPPAAKNTS